MVGCAQGVARPQARQTRGRHATLDARAGGSSLWCRRWEHSCRKRRAGTATRPRSSSMAAASRSTTLEAQSNAFANGLVAAGIAPGDTVTLYGPNSWQWMVAYYAIAKTGAVVNPVNTLLTPEEVKYIVKDCGARAVVASEDKAGPLHGHEGRHRPVAGGDLGRQGAGRAPRPSSAGSVRARPRSRRGRAAPRIPAPSATPPAPPATPRARCRAMRSIVATAKGTALMHSRTSADIIVSPLPNPHVYGSCVFNAAMLAGATLVLLPRFTEEGVLEAIQKHRATMFDCVPTAYYYLLAHPKFAQLRPLLAHALHGGRPDAAGRQVARVHRAHQGAGAGAVGHDGAGRRRHLQPVLGRQQARHHRPADARHVLQDRRRRRCGQGDASGRARRADDQGPAGDGRLRRQREEHARDGPRPTAGCTRATSPPSTRTATTPSSTARRT